MESVAYCLRVLKWMHFIDSLECNLIHRKLCMLYVSLKFKRADSNKSETHTHTKHQKQSKNKQQGKAPSHLEALRILPLTLLGSVIQWFRSSNLFNWIWGQYGCSSSHRHLPPWFPVSILFFLTSRYLFSASSLLPKAVCPGREAT